MIEAVVQVTEWLCARRKAVLALSAALGLGCLPFAVLLFSNLRTQVEDLLPESSPSIQALARLHARLGDNMQLAILVSGANSRDRHRFVDRLASESARLPSPPRLVDFKTDEVQRFFEERRALFLDLADLEKIDQRVAERVARGEPGLDRSLFGDDLLDKYQRRLGGSFGHPSGYYDSDDARTTAIIFYPQETATRYEGALAFRDSIDDLGRRLARELGLVQLRLQYTGEVEATLQELRSLRADLVTSSVLVLLLEALLVLAFYRWWPSLVALGMPLAAGVSCTFALGFGLIGSLNSASAFLGSIIAGNGVNSGIILLGRYVEERRRRIAPSLAMRTAVAKTVAPTCVASAAATVAYAALMSTTFRGFSHFGLLGATGMVLCWLANYLLVPPLALWMDERWRVVPCENTRPLDRFFEALGRLSASRPALVAAAAATLSLASTVPMARLARDPIEEDTTTLRSRWATEPGGYLDIDRRVDAILQRVMTPAVILVERPEQAKEVEAAYRALIEQKPAGSLLGQVLTLQSLVPDEQESKVAVLGRIGRRLLATEALDLHLAADEPEKPYAALGGWLTPPGLAGIEERQVAAATRWLAAQPFGIDDLPQHARRLFREKDGSEGKLVLVFPKHGTRTSSTHVLQRFASEVRSVPLPKDACAAGAYLAFADMLESVRRDAPTATLLAFLGVGLLSLLLARGLRGSIVVTLSLLAGALWTCGLAAATGMKLNFLNFLALPITFGIGVDYAANVYGRYRAGPPGRDAAIQAVAKSGACVALTSATTIVGYSSLLLSRNGALFSFGLLAVLGELSCLAAALVLPAAMLAGRAAALDGVRESAVQDS